MDKNDAPLDLATLRTWQFITSHGHVLLALARDPDATVSQLAEAAGITERTAYRVLADLQRAGYVRRRKNGRKNRYELNPKLPLRDQTVQHELVADLLKLVTEREDVSAHRLVLAGR